MKVAWAVGVCTLSLIALGASGCALPHRHHGHHEVEYYHSHGLSCGCVVRCHYYRGVHHYAHHDYRGAYWHRHPVGHGYYARCHVVRGVHYYEHY